jgi:hypothetical protein
MQYAALVIAVCVLAQQASAALRICILSDTQYLTSCRAPDTAVDRMDAVMEWLSDNATARCDAIVIGGDYRTSPDYCYCGVFPNPDTCPLYSTSLPEQTCVGIFCNNADSQGCRYGFVDHPQVAGVDGFCDWERVEYLFDGLKSTGVPGIGCAGNHDTMSATQRSWAAHDLYVPTSVWNIDESGEYTEPAEGVRSSYMVVNKDGIDWLFLALGYPIADAAGANLVAYGESVIAAHEGMPTIVLFHRGLRPDGVWDTVSPWSLIDIGVNKYPQVFLTLTFHYGGAWNPHVHDYHIERTHPVSGEQIVGLEHDYSYSASVDTGMPSWVTRANGGGGVIGFVFVDARAGVIAKRSWSEVGGGSVSEPPTAYCDACSPEFVTVDSEAPDQSNKVDARYSLPICGDRKRFTAIRTPLCDPALTRARGWWNQ